MYCSLRAAAVQGDAGAASDLDSSARYRVVRRLAAPYVRITGTERCELGGGKRVEG